MKANPIDIHCGYINKSLLQHSSSLVYLIPDHTFVL